MKIKNCEAIFHILFDTSIGPSNYRYKVDVSVELIPFIYHPITSGRGELVVTGNILMFYIFNYIIFVNENKYNCN